MGDYIQLNCNFTGGVEQAEMITAFLADYGFEMFEDAPDGLMAYIPFLSFSETEIQSLTSILNFSYSYKNIPSQNWNEEWEKNFPLLIHENVFSVRAPFHEKPENISHNIIIEPDMSFGTGHHQTTFMMLDEILKLDLKNKNVLDMGAGTGILSIMASLLGAKEILAVENNERAFHNVYLNLKHNEIENVNVLLGSIEMVKEQKFNLILANINRNILIDQMESYFHILQSQGCLLMSGFLVDDVSLLIEAAEKFGFKNVSIREKDQWALLSCQK